MPKAEDIIYNKMLEMVNRREKAGRMRPRCPSCGNEQVQITDWRTSKVKFKCRICKTRFDLLITKEDRGNVQCNGRVRNRSADGRFASELPRDESSE